MQQIIEKYLENGKPIYALFLDHSKAFDIVRDNGLWRILDKLNTPVLNTPVQLFESLYEDCTAVAHVARLICGTRTPLRSTVG